MWRSIPGPSSGRWRVRPGPKADDGELRRNDHADDLTGRYEALRAIAVPEGAGRAGLGAALLVSHGMAAWMRGWRACAPAAPSVVAPVSSGPPAEVVGVLAAMALACAGG